MTERALTMASQKAPGEEMMFGVHLAKRSFDFSRLRLATESARAEMVEERRAALKADQDAVARGIAQLGGVVTHRSWLTNMLHVRLTAGRANALAQLEKVAAISAEEFADETRQQEEGWNGRMIRTGLLIEDADLSGGDHAFTDGCYSSPADADTCHDGNTNSNSGGGAQRIALIELGVSPDNLILRNHVGWKEHATSSSARIRKVMNCTVSPCVTTAATGTGDNHGTRVGWAAAGSIEQGQDSAYPGTHTAAQRTRSGVSGESHIYYYLVGNSLDTARAIEQSVMDNVDIINMSQAVGHGCDTAPVPTYSYDINGINEALSNALNAGVLPIKSAGNTGDNGSTCRITYPAWRPHVLTVSGLESDVSQPNMNLLNRYVDSSRGGAVYRLLGSPSVDRIFSGIGVAAPACIDNYFSSDGAGYTVFERCGTSYATATVSGVAANLRDALNHVGWNEQASDARILMAMLLVMGDAWDSDQSVGSWLGSGVSKGSGFGRLHAHWPHSSNLVGPWGWGAEVLSINEGEAITLNVGSSAAESSAITQWKWAITWFDDDISQSSDIIIRVRDACNGNQIINWDHSWDMRKRIHLRASNIGGKCLKMEIVANQTPLGGTTFVTTDYFHSGDAANEH